MPKRNENYAYRKIYSRTFKAEMLPLAKNREATQMCINS
jgi:hypothetical protein